MISCGRPPRKSTRRSSISRSASPPLNGSAPPTKRAWPSTGTTVSHPTRADLGKLLAELVDGGVELVVVGGAAAVLHGAPTATFDLDVVPRRTPENAQRLAAVLARLDASIRDGTDRRLRPDPALLQGPGQLLLSTSCGPLDLLGCLHDGRSFDDLIAHTEIVSDGRHDLRVIDLETLIDIKSKAGRAKDKLVLPVLLALKARREGQK